MFKDEELSAAVLTYVGFDRDSAVPGRHLDRIADGQLRSRVMALISEVDSLPGDGSQDLFAWAEQRRVAIAEAHPELTDDALIALRALLSFEWR